MKEECHLR
jgi:hypothetical protein